MLAMVAQVYQKQAKLLVCNLAQLKKSKTCLPHPIRVLNLLKGRLVGTRARFGGEQLRVNVFNLTKCNVREHNSSLCTFQVEIKALKLETLPFLMVIKNLLTPIFLLKSITPPLYAFSSLCKYII